MPNERVGLIDVDAESRGRVTFPNLALMKISGWHKAQGDTVEWYNPDFQKYDVVYMSKVFSDEYSKDYDKPVYADRIIRGGSGYAIKVENGREVYHKEADPPLPAEVEHCYPDYELYGIRDATYGFLTRGCPRKCEFCHVSGMQGAKSHTVARLSEFWRGEKKICLLDPNILACKDWKMHFEDLIDSKAKVDFNQGLDIRLLNEEKIEMLNEMNAKMIHFAWDRADQDLRENFRTVKAKLKKCSRSNTSCYILANNGESIENAIERVEFIKSLNIQPYVMLYRKQTAPKVLRKLQRYANNPIICWSADKFENYLKYQGEKKNDV